MIVDLVLDFFQAIIEGVLGLVPSVAFIGEWTEAFSSALVEVASLASMFSPWVPFEFMGAVVAAVIVWRLAMMLFGFALRIYGMVRGGGTE